jgi:uncharacterized delta-60 repeat protein
MRTKITLGILLVSHGLHAQSYLDPTWGNGGIVQPEPCGAMPDAYPTAEGNVMVCGHNFLNDSTSQGYVARYLANGTLDPTWSGDGIANIAMGATSSYLRAVGRQSGGRVIAVGMTAGTGQPMKALIVGFRGDGSLDPSFGVGGIVQVEVADRTELNDLAIDSQQRIYGVGHTFNGTNFGLLAIRLTPNGILDPNYNGTGIQYHELVGTEINYHIDRCALSPDGGLMILSDRYEEDETSHMTVNRVRPNGTWDTDLNSGNGTFVLDMPSRMGDIVVRPNGKILLAIATTSTAQAALVQLDPQGTLDATFNGTGMTIYSLQASEATISGLVLEADGSAIFGGVQWSPDTDKLFLVRADEEGVLDPLFGNNGIIVEPLVHPGSVGLVSPRRISMDVQGHVYVCTFDSAFCNAVVRFENMNTSTGIHLDRTQRINYYR